MPLPHEACTWCEPLSAICDLIGFAGALALAYPFLAGQHVRDVLILLSQVRIPHDEDRAELAVDIRELTDRVANNMAFEYRVAWIGALLIALAFIGRFAATVSG